MKKIVWLQVTLLVTLASCIPSFQSEALPQGVRPETELDIKTLTSAFDDTSLIDESEGNCPIGDIEIPGEGSRAMGTIGGLAIAPNPVDASGASIIPTFDPLEAGKRMFDIAEFNPNERAAIIIVDDFNGNLKLEQRDNIHAELGLPGVYFLDQQRGQPTLAGPTSGATEADVTALEDAGQYSHGALVFNHTLALLSAGDRNPELSVIPVFVSDREEAINVLVFTFTKPNVAVVALDTEDFNTEIIGRRLQATIQTLAQERQIRRFAVNLSFGLVPCSVLADIKAGVEKEPNLTFDEYQDEVLNANGLDAEQFRDDLVNVLTTPVNVTGDPLLVAAQTDPEGLALAAVTDVTYLAASGNYGLPYSLYPGYWSEFVSVSAHNLASTSAAPDEYSNTGEIILPGGYFRLTAYDPRTGSWNTYPEISVAGTSFAAPVMSVFTALDFTLPAPRCARVSPSITSPLAFFKTDPTPTALPASGLNIALTDALRRYCP